jgi:hypothetical protein
MLEQGILLDQQCQEHEKNAEIITENIQQAFVSSIN